jgi:hypothetical protein
LTLVLFALTFAGLEVAILHLPTLGAPWVNRLIELLTPLIFVVAAFLLGAPVRRCSRPFFSIASRARSRRAPIPVSRRRPACRPQRG